MENPKTGRERERAELQALTGQAWPCSSNRRLERRPWRGGTGWLAAARTETLCRSRPWLFWSGRQDLCSCSNCPFAPAVVLNSTRLKSTVLYLAVSPPARHDLDLDVSPPIPCPHGGNRRHSHACHILAPSLPRSRSPAPHLRPAHDRPTTHGPRLAPSHLPPLPLRPPCRFLNSHGPGSLTIKQGRRLLRTCQTPHLPLGTHTVSDLPADLNAKTITTSPELRPETLDDTSQDGILSTPGPHSPQQFDAARMPAVTIDRISRTWISNGPHPASSQKHSTHDPSAL